MKFLIIFIYGLAIYPSFAQVKIKDQSSNEPITYVELLNGSGRIIGLCNEEGIVNSELLIKIKNDTSKFIQLHHLGYNDLLLEKNIFLNKDEIFMQRKFRNLEGVSIKPSKKTDYLELRGYYRSYSIIDSKIENFADGEIVYLFPKKSGNNIHNLRVQERGYVPKKRGEGSVIQILGPKVPDMDLMNTNRKNDFEYLDNTSPNYFLIKNMDNVKVEEKTLLNGNKLIVYNTAFISPNQPLILTRGNRHSVMNYHNEFSAFNCSSLSDVSLENIIYHKEIRKYKMKLKEDKVFRDIEDIGEFFIYDARYVDKPQKGFRLFTGFNNESKYATDFWKTAEKHSFYQPLPSGITESINNDLIILPNIHIK